MSRSVAEFLERSRSCKSFTLSLEDCISTKDVTVVRLNFDATSTGAAYDTEEVDLDYDSFVGDARRSPLDKSDEDVAFALAAGRALEQVSRQFLRYASGRIKHKDDMKAQNAEQREAEVDTRPEVDWERITRPKVKR